MVREVLQCSGLCSMSIKANFTFLIHKWVKNFNFKWTSYTVCTLIHTRAPRHVCIWRVHIRFHCSLMPRSVNMILEWDFINRGRWKRGFTFAILHTKRKHTCASPHACAHTNTHTQSGWSELNRVYPDTVFTWPGGFGKQPCCFNHWNS